MSPLTPLLPTPPQHWVCGCISAVLSFFTWMLEILTQILMLAQQGICSLKHLPRSGELQVKKEKLIIQVVREMLGWVKSGFLYDETCWASKYTALKVNLQIHFSRKFFNFYFLWVQVFCVLCTMWEQCLQRPKEGVGSLGTRVTGDCEATM